MGSDKMGRTIVLSVSGSAASEAAFQRALQELCPDRDALLIVFPRPYRQLDPHYNFVMKPTLEAINCEARAVLEKFSALATEAKVSFEAVEAEGFHAVEALAEVCLWANADLLVQGSATQAASTGRLLSRMLKLGTAGRGPLADFCPACNPYLRAHGRPVAARGGCGKGALLSPGCPVLSVQVDTSEPGLGGPRGWMVVQKLSRSGSLQTYMPLQMQAPAS